MDNQKALQHIKTAYGFGILSGVITLIATILSILGIFNLGLDIFSLVDVALIFGLTFGISKKSRVCAIILFIYYIGCKIDMLLNNNHISGSTVTMIPFIIAYFQGIRGTIHYHKNMKLESGNNETLSV